MSETFFKPQQATIEQSNIQAIEQELPQSCIAGHPTIAQFCNAIQAVNARNYQGYGSPDLSTTKEDTGFIICRAVINSAFCVAILHTLFHSSVVISNRLVQQP